MSQHIEHLHEEARNFMDRRPYLPQASLDEWLVEHHGALSDAERREGARILLKFPEYGGFDGS
jgi:hypothetical protein